MIHICGGYPLCGECRIQGSKNAVLPILAAAVLVEGTVTLENCPRITDVACMLKLLMGIGCRVQQDGAVITVDAGCITGEELSDAYVSKMRSSVILMGSMLGRKRKVCISYPGGCIIGKRPIDLHLQAFSKMGMEFTEEKQRLRAYAPQLCGSEITLPFPSVGATENIILAAVLAEGETRIRGAAKEPEICSLCEFLCCAGADIVWEDTGTIRIQGVKKLHSVSFRIPPDRIVTGTYLLGCMAAGGEVCLKETRAQELMEVLSVITQMGGELNCQKNEIFLKAPVRAQAVPYLKTAVYPGYPTDLQSPLLAVLSLAAGESCIEEAIFEDRFRVACQLCKMGADIVIKKNLALIRGVKELKGAKVRAQELRGGGALALAALAAKGESLIENRHFIDRGYEDLERDLRCLGGRI